MVPGSNATVLQFCASRTDPAKASLTLLRANGGRRPEQRFAMRAPSDDRRRQDPRDLAPGPSLGNERLWRLPPGEMREEPRSRSDSHSPIFAAVVATLLGAMALIGLREKIVGISPRAAAPFAAVGLPVNLDGLALSAVRSRVAVEGPRKVLLVEGEIVNLRRDANSLPPLALSLRGVDGRDRYAWTTRAPKARLEPGERVAFHARLVSPPEDGAEMLVRFARNELATR